MVTDDYSTIIVDYYCKIIIYVNNYLWLLVIITDYWWLFYDYFIIIYDY